MVSVSVQLCFMDSSRMLIVTAPLTEQSKVVYDIVKSHLNCAVHGKQEGPAWGLQLESTFTRTGWLETEQIYGCDFKLVSMDIFISVLF